MPNEFIPQDGPLPGPTYPSPPIVYPPVQEMDPRLRRISLEILLQRILGKGSKTLGSVDEMPYPNPTPYKDTPLNRALSGVRG